jgi:hypothetical protein
MFTTTLSRASKQLLALKLARASKRGYGRFGGSEKMLEKIYGRKWDGRDWLVFFTIIFIGIGAIAVRQIAYPNDDITGSVSKAEPPMSQDGTPARPYADESQCPASTDIVFRPNGRAIPSIPPSISVCFVGDQSVSDSGGPNLEVRGR